MYVCVCKAITDERIKKAIVEGAKTLKDISITCGGAGSDCKICCKTIKDLLKKHKR